MGSEHESNHTLFAALSDPTRTQLLDVLAMHGVATASELAGELPVSRQAVMKHLGVLDRAGLVRGTRVGREVRYELLPDRLSAAAEWMARVAEDWDVRLRSFSDAEGSTT